MSQVQNFTNTNTPGIVDSIIAGPGILVDTPTGNVTISLDNYVAKTATTTNATPDLTMTIPLGAVPGVYTLDINVSAFNLTDIAGAGFSLFSSVRTDGAAATLIDSADYIANLEANMATAMIDVAVSGNNAIIKVTGIAAKTIHWKSIIFYTFVS